MRFETETEMETASEPPKRVEEERAGKPLCGLGHGRGSEKCRRGVGGGWWLATQSPRDKAKSDGVHF